MSALSLSARCFAGVSKVKYAVSDGSEMLTFTVRTSGLTEPTTAELAKHARRGDSETSVKRPVSISGEALPSSQSAKGPTVGVALADHLDSFAAPEIPAPIKARRVHTVTHSNGSTTDYPQSAQ